MPITTSAKKALRQSLRRKVQNDRRRRAFREAVKSVRKAVAAGKPAEAKTLLPQLYKTLDKAAKTNVITKNKASRLKSRITAAVNRPAG
ncbi:30S ribosomal protein S20 [Candidatus Parcubacteria bacterium]|nr:30S ribosomal protein S20 [Candidatus Parcubacteria bacterium]